MPNCAMDTTALRPFAFLDLPNEVRLSIYVYLLHTPDRVYICGAGLPTWSRATQQTSSSPRIINVSSQILSTCRQVHQEAAHTLYTTNLFHFECEESFDPFLDTIGPLHTYQIQAAAISCWNSETLYQWDLGSMWKSFKRLSNLQTLHIKVLVPYGVVHGIGDRMDQVLGLARTLAERHPSLRTGEKLVVRGSEPSRQHGDFKLVSGDYQQIPGWSQARAQNGVPHDAIREFEMEAALISDMFGER